MRTPSTISKSVCAVLLSLAGFTVHAQTFEVASIHLCAENDTRQTNIDLPTKQSGRLTLQRASLGLLFQLAYGVDGYQLEEPSWTKDTYYDISAITTDEKPVTMEQFRPMLQKLLEERLHLAAHRETKKSDGYALTVAKGGSKLTPSTKSDGVPGVFPNAIIADHASTDLLAHLLIFPVGHPIVNKTGIFGNFDIRLKYSRLSDTDSDQPSVFGAVKEQLGLQLEPQKVPVEMIVIDKVDKVPAEN